VAVRWLNVYGDLNPWEPQKNALFTAFSFVNCKKYPPSLCFLLMTLGPVLLALGLADRRWGPVGRRLVTLGQVPLFFYLTQWTLAHALAVVLSLATAQPVAWLFASRPFQSPPGAGYGLPVVYLMWGVSLAILYPLCARFADLKRRKGKEYWVLRYL
jgi:hypothetical protein